MRQTIIAVAVLLAGPALAQGVDPQAVLDQLLRQKQLERQQQFEDGQQQRLRDQEEAAFDRAMCQRVGYRGSAIEQCVRDSALARRNAGRIPPAARPGVVCSTVAAGGGMFDTICD